jgi:hypothetical protein
VSAECVWRRAAILDVSAEPYDPRYPVVGFAESPYPLVSEGRQPLPRAPGRPVRDDDEYGRAGTCNLCMGWPALQGWRHLQVTARRTAQDGAPWRPALLDHHGPTAQVIRGGLDTLTPQTPAALSDTLAPADARRRRWKLDFRETPTQGRWRNRAAIAGAVVAKPGLDQRRPHPSPGRRKLADGAAPRKAAQAPVHGPLTPAKARRQRRGRYPR